MDQINILVVDDEKEIADLVEIYLVSDGYKVFKANNALDGLELIEKEDIHLVLLDIMMPGMDGVEVLKEIRSRTETRKIPVIMATAKGTEMDKIQSLDTGADDYLVKPFGVMEMVSRIKAVLRRCEPEEISDVLRIAELTLNDKEHTVSVNGEKVALTFKEFEILKLFMSNPGVAFSREKLLSEIWGIDYLGESRTVDMHIKTLRQKLGESGKRIETVIGVGYRMEGGQ